MTRTTTFLLAISVIAAAVLATTSEQRNPEMNHSTNGVAAGPVTFNPAPVVPLASQPPPRLIVDAPLAEQLAAGYVVIRYRVENLRIMPVYGAAALGVSPRIGHLHITVDDLPWHWLDASGDPLSINGLPAGPHRVLIEVEDPTHKVMDAATVRFDIPQKSAVQH